MDVRGWNAFDAETRAALRRALARGVDCYGEPLAMAVRGETAVLAAVSKAPMRACHLRARFGAGANGALDTLAQSDAVVCDDEGFFAPP